MDIRKLDNQPILTDDQQLQIKEQLVQQVDAQIIDMIESSAAQGSSAPSSGPENIGTSQQALTGPDNTTHLPNHESMPYYDQGTQNACGTTTLAEIMTYLGVPQTKDDIDSAIRRMDIFTSPNDMIEYARDHGLEAEGYNQGNWEEVKSHIDSGHPVQALIQADITYPDGSSIKGQHYIAITGYEKDPVTGEEYVLYHDPNIGDDPNTPANEGVEQRMSVKDFERMWGDVGFGFDNYFIAYGAPGTALPPGRDEGIEGVLGTLDGVTNLTNGLNRLYSPDSFGSWVHGLFQFPGGIVQTIGSGIGGLLSMGGQWLHGAVEDIPVLENIVQPFAGLVDTFGSAVGDIFNGVGEAVDSVGGAFESLFDGDVGGFFEGMGDAVGDVVGGVVDAVGDVVEGIGDAVSDFFSGW